MTIKQYLNGLELHQKMLQGVNKLSDYVCTTLGPKGKTVAIYNKNQQPIITKDGVTVANAFELEDRIENLAVDTVKQASNKTNLEAGDATTTTVLLTKSIYANSIKYIATGMNANEIKKGIERTSELLISELKSFSRPISTIKDIENIATISANNDKIIGAMLAEAIEKAGKDGSVSVQEGRSNKTTLSTTEGFIFDSGYVSPRFITDKRRNSVRYEDALILVSDLSFSSISQLMPLLQIVARAGKSLVIVCSSIEAEALAALIINTIRGTMKVSAIAAPKFGEEQIEFLEDLALSIGAKYISKLERDNLDGISLTDLGSCKTIEISSKQTTILGGLGKSSHIRSRIDDLKVLLDNSNIDISDKEKMQDRITRLQGIVSTIFVGGATEAEMLEKKFRVEDSLSAIRSAKEGIIPGGGLTIMRALHNIKHSVLSFDNYEQEVGFKILCEAIKEPFILLSRMSNVNNSFVINKLLDNPYSEDINVVYDFSKCELVNAWDSGIVEPYKVVACALRNAVSAANVLLSLDAGIYEI